MRDPWVAHFEIDETLLGHAATRPVAIGIPADLSLEAEFWPDIALRYDEFRLEVYDSVGVESA